jgi:hypothetical protein
VTSNGGPVELFRNGVEANGAWLGLRLLDAGGRRDALGARVEAARAGAPALVRRVRTDGSYLSAGDGRLLFPTAPAPIASLRVTWPDGSSEVFAPPPAGRYHELRQRAAAGSQERSP